MFSYLFCNHRCLLINMASVANFIPSERLVEHQDISTLCAKLLIEISQSEVIYFAKFSELFLIFVYCLWFSKKMETLIILVTFPLTEDFQSKSGFQVPWIWSMTFVSKLLLNCIYKAVWTSYSVFTHEVFVCPFLDVDSIFVWLFGLQLLHIFLETLNSSFPPVWLSRTLALRRIFSSPNRLLKCADTL